MYVCVCVRIKERREKIAPPSCEPLKAGDKLEVHCCTAGLQQTRIFPFTCSMIDLRGLDNHVDLDISKLLDMFFFYGKLDSEWICNC